jgi:hypothetical protein
MSEMKLNLLYKKSCPIKHYAIKVYGEVDV